jgi:hypothetical protein
LKDRGRQNKLESTGTAYIWHSKQERNIWIIKMINRQICNDNEIQNLFLMMSVISLIFYQNIKYTVHGAENYTDFCSRNDRRGLVSMSGSQEAKRDKKRNGKMNVPCVWETKMLVHIMLSCTETKSAIYE